MHALRLLALSVFAALPALAGCATQPVNGGANCPGCGLLLVSVTYTGSFVQGVQQTPPPVRFTRTGQTATLQFTASKGNGPLPSAPVSGSFSPPCSAATVQSGPGLGQLTVTSTASGNCTILADTGYGVISVLIAVP